MKISFTRHIAGKPPVHISIETEADDLPILEVWKDLIVPALKAAGYTANQIDTLFDKD